MNLTEISLRRPITTLMIFACFIVIGVIAGRLLPLEFLPDVDFPGVFINIPYRGSTPEEVERLITQPAEEVLATVGGVKRLVSDSGENGVGIRMEFKWGEQTTLKALEVKEKLDGIRNQFPQDVERIYVSQWSTTDMPILQLRISSNRDLSDAYDMLNRNIKRRIERLDGVSKVDLYGVEKKEIRIELFIDRIVEHRIDLAHLTELLQRSNFSVTAGRITDTNRRYVVRPIGEFRTVDEIGELIIDNNKLRLNDIARISHTSPELEYGRHLNRRYAVGLDVFKEAGANTVEVANEINAEIQEISKNPEMEGINIYYMDDAAEGIVSSLVELLKSGLMGALLAIVVLYFFLRRLDTTLIVAMAVPFSLLVTLAFLYFFGMTLNILSMMGLMLAVGMLVDNAVVITESIQRHQQIEKNVSKATIVGVKEVVLAVTAGTLTTAIVFLPNIINPRDEISTWLKFVSVTICVALGASLVIAQTVIPLLTTRIPFRHGAKKQTVIDKLLHRYGRTLDWMLHHRKISISIIFLILASVAIPMRLVKQDMFPSQEDRRLRLHYHINGNYALEKVENTVNLMEEYLFSNQDEFEIESIYSYYRGNYAMSTIILTDQDQSRKSQEQIQEEIRDGLPKLSIAEPSFDWEQPNQGGNAVRIQLVGKSSEVLTELSHDVARVLHQVPGLTDVRSEAEVGEKEVHVVVDRKRARQYGFSTQEIARTVAGAMRGINLRRFRSRDGEIEVRMQFYESDKKTLENLRNLPLFNGGKQPVKLASLADFRIQRGPRTIHRENRATSIGVSANLNDLTVGEAKEKINKMLGQYNFPAGYSWNYGQSFSEEDEAKNIMMTNILLALALIYFVMAALFESLIFPAAIWTSIIFAIVGVWWFFLITSTVFSVMAWIGVLILIGVVVNNGIVLIDHINQLRAQGHSRHEAIVQAGRNRLRPILMTAGTTVLGLVPLCIGGTQVGGTNGPPYFPMARAIVGGLTFSTMVTLIVLPTIYILLDDLRNWARMVVHQAR